MGHFGFSYVGLIYLLMLFIPNIIWSKNKPRGYEELAAKESRVLLLFERVGQALTVCSALVFSDFNLSPFAPRSLWLYASAALMVLYELAWLKFFKSPRTLKDFYGSFLKIPLPLAVLPVAAFITLGVYGRVIWLVASAIILGVGHIGIHIAHYKQIV